MTAVSALELAHPLGRADRVLLVGQGCPKTLIPRRAGVAGTEADIVVLAPNQREARDDAWLDSAARYASTALAVEGLVFVVAPVRARRTLLTALGRAGVAETTPFVHLPNRKLGLLLAPVSAPLARYVLENLGAPASISAGVTGLRIPQAARLASGLLGSVVVAVQRKCSRPLFHWLLGLSDAAPSAGTALIVRSWRGVHHGMILHCFAEAAQTPWAIGKVGSTGNGDTEGARLAALGPAARAAGARVAEVLAETTVRHQPFILQTPVRGQVLARVLRRDRRELLHAVDRIAEWLLAWNAATAQRTPHDLTAVGDAVTAAARELAPHIDDRGSYLDWLTARCTSIASSAPPLVSAHHDLTMWNVVLDEEGVLGVHDWEAAEESALPLGDVFYALADAAAAARGYRSRIEAVRSCVEPGGLLTPRVRDIIRRFRQALDLTPETIELCFHACWLRHAANEQRRAVSGNQRPFLEIVQWAAATRPRLV